MVVTPVWPEAGVDARAAYARASERIEDAVADLERPLPRQRRRRPPTCRADAAIESNMTHDEYFDVVRARQGIHPRGRHLPGGAQPALPPRPSRCRPSRSIARCGG